MTEYGQRRSSAQVEAAAERAVATSALIVRHPFQAHRHDWQSDSDAAGHSVFARRALLLRFLARHMGIAITAPTAVQAQRADLLSYAANAGLIMRRVTLPERWWRQDLGPLLTATAEGEPVALVPKGRGYRMWTAPEDRGRPVTNETAAGLSTQAYTLLPQLPEPVTSPWQLARYGLRGNAGWLATSVAVSVLVGLLAMIGPLAMRALWDVAVPSVDYSLLAGLLTFVVATALAATALRLIAAFASLRVQARYESFVRPALWFRLTRVRASYFGSHSIGQLSQQVDLVPTVFGISIKPALSLIAMVTLGVPALVMMLYLSWQLTVVASALLLVPLVVSTLVAWRSARLVTQQLPVDAVLQAREHSLLAGVSALRVAGAEAFGLRWWASAVSSRQRLAVRQRHLEMAVTAFAMTWPIAVTAIIYWVVGTVLLGEISVGTYLAFMAAYGIFKGAVGKVPLTIAVLFTLSRVWQGCRELFEAPLERGLGAIDPGVLTGAVSVRDLRYHYPGGPEVLTGVSFDVAPGEYVALVGASGSGKSTLVNLLLGLAEPDSGTISYNNVDFATLDASLVRQQMGVMTQRMRPIGNNIRAVVDGSRELTDTQVWQALGQANLAPTVKKLPMGLLTYLDDGTSTLSGGEVQRLLFARALAGDPKILLLDEATAALDDLSQATVAEAVGQRDVTRIVVAHRLSTITNADRVLVLVNGEIVQQGSPAELLAQPGPFATLMAPQVGQRSLH